MGKKKESETMGGRLKRLRKTKGFSQPELAIAAGVSVSAVRNWEQDRRLPLFETAIRVADVLGISLDELAGRQGFKPSTN